MRIQQLSLYAVLSVVACNGRLVVGPTPTASAGSANSGIAGSDAGNGVGGLSDGEAGRRSGGGGSSGVSNPTTGRLGQPCTSGALLSEGVEGIDGTASTIQSLSHCDEGLSCNTDGNCVIAPDCPEDSDVCVVRHATLGDNVGADPPQSAWGIPESSSYARSIERNGVMALTASESRVFWVEYGTRDAAGDYQHDGTLLSYTPEDGTTSVIATDLEGPIGVEVTSSHAYVYVDGAQPLGKPIHAQLLRVPLSGGSTELVQEDTFPTGFTGSHFVAADGRAFWSTEGTEIPPNLYSMTADTAAVPSVFVAEHVISMAVDGSYLYYSSPSALLRSPTAAAAPVAIQEPQLDFVLHDGAIYTVLGVNSDGGILARTALSGGGPDRVRGLGSGGPMRLRRVGDRFFFESVPLSSDTGQRRVMTASFVNDDPPIQLLTRPNRRSSIDHLWVGTSSALYWSDGRAVYKQTLPTQ